MRISKKEECELEYVYEGSAHIYASMVLVCCPLFFIGLVYLPEIAPLDSFNYSLFDNFKYSLLVGVTFTVMYTLSHSLFYSFFSKLWLRSPVDEEDLKHVSILSLPPGIREALRKVKTNRDVQDLIPEINAHLHQANLLNEEGDYKKSNA